ncbi:NAD(P)-dependent oxidoreductase [Lysobacter hankyongensis]|uniref:NAD(P)-dependent oxidoreductase n=1 Tax=Lysobacter hankyongensis TaxID=1176535 RepID=A0ABP9C1L0_9GAMM
MKILLTGASGFIGGRFMQRFRDMPGLELLGVGRRAMADADYRAVDLSRPFNLDFTPDVVIHAAALSSPFAPRREYLRHNVDATRHVIDWCRAHDLPKLIYISSSSVHYRPCDQLGIREDDPIGPAFANTYAETKAAGETLVRDYPGAWTILRPRAVFGPGDTVLFPRLLAAAKRGRLPRIVRDGPPAVGDLISVDALADYMLRAAQRSDAVGAFNLSHGEPVPMQAFIADIFRRLDLPPPTRTVSYRVARAAAHAAELAWTALPLRGEPPVTRFGIDVLSFSKTFDIAKARAVLGPPSQTLAEGIETFVAWQKAQPA